MSSRRAWVLPVLVIEPCTRDEPEECSDGTSPTNEAMLFPLKRCQSPISTASPNPVTLARLRAGDMFGEMSLVTDQPTSATVRATTATTVLYLAREYVERLGEAVPEVQAYFEQLALNRARDNSLRAEKGAVPSEEVDVDLSDVIPI